MNPIDINKIEYHPIDASTIEYHPEESNALSDIKDASMGALQGLTLGGADELGGGLSALYSKLLDSNDPDSKLGIIDLYRKKQQELQHTFDQSQERSPWLYGAGQIAGGAISGSTIGGALGIGAKAAGIGEATLAGEAAAGINGLSKLDKAIAVSKGLIPAREAVGSELATVGSGLSKLRGVAEALPAAESVAPSLGNIIQNPSKVEALKGVLGRGFDTYKQALPVILGESALSSKEGGLTSIDEAKQLGKDVLGGAAFALPLTLGLQGTVEGAGALSKKLKGYVQENAKESPLIRQMKKQYDYGTQNINPSTESAKFGELAHIDTDRTNEMLDVLDKTRQSIGRDVKESLISATNSGKVVNIDPQINESLKTLKTVVDRFPEISSDKDAKKIFEKIALSDKGISPLETHDLIDYIDDAISEFKPSAMTDRVSNNVLKTLYKTRSEISNALKTQVPEYGLQANRFAEFMTVPEQLISGDVPVEVKNLYYSNVNKVDEKAYQKMKQLLQGTTKMGSGTKQVRDSYNNVMQRMNDFEVEELQRVARGEIPESALTKTAKQFGEQIKDYSDDAVSRGSADALAPRSGLGTTVEKAVTGIGETGHSALLKGANLAGRLKTPLSSATTMNPIAKMSRAIYNAPHETVNALAGKLKNQPGLEKYGQNLEHALQSPDTNKRNQVLFTIMQNPSARAFVDQDSQEPQE